MPPPNLTIDDSVLADDLMRIIAACERFEAAWNAGQPGRIANEMVEAPEALQRRLFRELLALELELARRDGRPVDLAPFVPSSQNEGGIELSARVNPHAQGDSKQSRRTDLRVIHFEFPYFAKVIEKIKEGGPVKEKSKAGGLLGRESFSARFDDEVTIQAELSEPVVSIIGRNLRSTKRPNMNTLRIVFRLGLLLGFGIASTGPPTSAQSTSSKARPPTASGLRELTRDEADRADNLGNILGYRGMYIQAQPALENALEISRRLPGDGYSNTASSYSNVAFNLDVAKRPLAASPAARALSGSPRPC